MKNREQSIVFRQSLGDFPCPVVLGKNMPSFGLHRYKQGLRFLPLDEEGFTMRGDKQRLLYKGRRRSHRFTILGDTSFEYDCILEKEPESNVVSLRIDGAEHFDFFRQPDFVKNPYLKGSYAVYKKVTFLGEGTGKLCHIHRPLIIDARGRRVWGELAVIGNELRITIPEWWLSEAKYPVVVDPEVGTKTIGAHWGFYEEGYQEDYYDEELDEWIEFDNPFTPFIPGGSIVANRYQIPYNLGGKVTAYVYLFLWDGVANYNNIIQPCLYSDKNNDPFQRLSSNEQYFDHEVNRTTKPDGWRSATFNVNQLVAAGSNVWLSICCGDLHPRFDYGKRCCVCWIDDCYEPPPDIYPIEWDWGKDWFGMDNVIISMYFDYNYPQNNIRTITQGIKLSDNRKFIGNYKRSLVQTAKANSIIMRFETFYRKCLVTAHNSMKITRFPSFVRLISAKINVIMTISEKQELSRKCVEGVNVNSKLTRIHNAIRNVKDYFCGIDNQYFSVLFLRSIANNAIVTQSNNHWGAFFRGLKNTAESTAETRHIADYNRLPRDTVQADTVVFRGLLLFVRIVSKIFIRDYLLGRFLKAREELVLKSGICREIVFESKI
jgi:hypothetical protein